MVYSGVSLAYKDQDEDKVSDIPADEGDVLDIEHTRCHTKTVVFDSAIAYVRRPDKVRWDEKQK